MRFKALQLAALRELPRTTPVAYQAIAAALRETVRDYIDNRPPLTPQAEEHLRLLLVDRMNRMEMDREIQCGRIVGVWRNDRERRITFDVEITPVMAVERLIINFTVSA